MGVYMLSYLILCHTHTVGGRFSISSWINGSSQNVSDLHGAADWKGFCTFWVATFESFIRFFFNLFFLSKMLENIQKIPLKELLEAISYVPQKNFLFSVALRPHLFKPKIKF